MKKINLFDMNNNKVQVYLVRFFKYRYDQYFIYTLNEQDVKGFVKLYLVKVVEEFDRLLSYHISDQEEWHNTQGILKTILGELKYNKEKTFEDLNPTLINGITIKKARVFKLEKKLVDLLSGSNQMIISTKQPVISQERESLQELNPEQLNQKYKEAMKEINRLNEIMGDLLAENIRYKSKYGNLD